MKLAGSVWVSALVLVAAAGCRTEPLAPGSQRDAGLDLSIGSPCAELTTEAACRAQQDCVADTCLECSCTPVFVGCRALAAAQTMCPALGCDPGNCCHTGSDCGQGFALCEVPPLGPNCPICRDEEPSTCSIDADCTTPGQICDAFPCQCHSPGKTCIAGCTGDTDCPEPQACGADLRCHDVVCDPSCTGNYVCGSDDTCRRRACSVDTDCGHPGYCVEHLCSRGLGECITPAQ